MKVIDVSDKTLQVYMFCKTFSRVYDFALGHRNGKSYLVVMKK
ncbi:MAG: hypothetical protein ACXQTI_02195 [Candidatus Nezhaarchaeales archaeon]